MRTETAITRARFANFFGLDLTKDFFTLDGKELTTLEVCRQAAGYNGRNNLGRSKCRQFYYHLQWGWKKYVEQLKERQQL